MGYNYDKGWLDQQKETIELLTELATQNKEVVYEFLSFNELQNFRLFIGSVRAGLSIHYPDIGQLVQGVRTWKEIDRETGAIYLHVATADKYQAPSRQIKTRHGKRSQGERKLRGALPSGPIDLSVSLGKYANVQPVPEADILDYDDPLTDENFHEVMPLLVESALGKRYGPPRSVIWIKQANLSPDIVKGILDSLPAWTIEDSTQGRHPDSNTPDGNVTMLKLRKRTSLEGQ